MTGCAGGRRARRSEGGCAGEGMREQEVAGVHRRWQEKVEVGRKPLA